MIMKKTQRLASVGNVLNKISILTLFFGVTAHSMSALETIVTQEKSSLTLSFLATKLSNTSQCHSVSTVLKMIQRSYLRENAIRCWKGQVDAKCENMPDGVVWNFPLGFTFNNVSLNFGGLYELSILCSENVLAKRRYLVVIQGEPTKPVLSNIRLDGRTEIQCESNSTSNPTREECPMQYTWTINGQIPDSQGYSVKYNGVGQTKIVLEEEHWERRCVDIIVCTASEKASSLQNRSDLTIHRKGYHLNIRCGYRVVNGGIECQPILTKSKNDPPLSQANLGKFEFMTLTWSINGLSLDAQMDVRHNVSDEITVEISEARLLVHFTGSGVIHIGCEATDECNRTKQASIEVQWTTTAESPTTGDLGYTIIWIGVGVALVCVLVLTIATPLLYKQCKKDEVANKNNQTADGNVDSEEMGVIGSKDPVNHKPCDDVYRTVRQSQVFPDEAVAEVRALIIERTVDRQTTPGERCPELPARDDTYDRAFSSEQSVTESTPPPQRPPSRGNMDEYKNYVQTTDFKDHVYT